MDVVKKSQVGAGVAVKIEHAVYESAKLFGRHFNGMSLSSLPSLMIHPAELACRL